jgi:hypothetical protein
MNRLLTALLLVAALILPVAASASVVIQFDPTAPSTNETATISYNGTYALPSPPAPPFAAAPFSFSATIAAQSYAPDGGGTGLSFSGVSGTYTNNGITIGYSNATLDLLAQYIDTYQNGYLVGQTEQTLLDLTVNSLLQTGDQYTLSLIAGRFLYTEQYPLVAAPLAAPCSSCSPAIVTMLTGPFSVLSGGLATYTPPLQLDPQAGVNTGGSGGVSSQLVAVPEPGSLILLGGAILMLALINWWVRRATAQKRVLTLR